MFFHSLFLHLYWICYNIVCVLCFGFFGREACGILPPRGEIELTPTSLEGNILTTGPPGKSPLHSQSHFMAQDGCHCIIHHIYILRGSKKGEEGKKMSCPLKSALFEELFYKSPQWFLLLFFG